MSVTVKLRLPVPEGKSGDVVSVSEERAAALVDRRYAIYVGSADAVVEAVEPETEAYISSGPAPETALPAATDKKEVWVAAAESLGIDLYNEDGSTKTKPELIADVEEATG